MRRSTLIALLAFTPVIASCALSTQPYQGAPPQTEMPAEARKPCAIYVLPPNAFHADEEIGYTSRGAQIVSCDKARQLAVQTFDLEHQLQAQALAQHAQRERPWWKFW